jgi:hypothetical protein
MLPYNRYEQSRFVFDPGRRRVWEAIAEYLQRYIPQEGSVLDLGSGYCDFINAIRARSRWAVDLYLDPARFVESGVVPLQRDVTDLAEIGDASLDAVFASNLLEHLPDDRLIATAQMVLQKLKVGGRLLLIQPNFAYCYRRYFDDYTHCRVFTDVSLADFLRSQGFSIERVAPRFLPFSMKSRAPKWKLLVRLYLRLPLKPFAAQMLVIARKEPQTPDADEPPPPAPAPEAAPPDSR